MPIEGNRRRSRETFKGRGCSLPTVRALATVNLPDSLVEIGIRSFYETGLVERRLPRAVKSVGKEAFERSRSLRRVVIPDSVANLDKTAFVGCRALVDGVCKYRNQSKPQIYEQMPLAFAKPQSRDDILVETSRGAQYEPSSKQIDRLL